MRDSTFSRPKLIPEQARPIDRYLEDVALIFGAYPDEPKRLKWKAGFDKSTVANAINSQHPSWNITAGHVMGRCRTFGHFHSMLPKPAPKTTIPPNAVWSGDRTEQLQQQIDALRGENSVMSVYINDLMEWATRCDPNWRK